MPSAIFNVHTPEQQWSRFWQTKSLTRELELCNYRELRLHLKGVLANLADPVVVEAGCGIGAWVAYLSRLGVRRVIGIDNYGPALSKLKLYEPKSLLIEADVRSLPLKDASVDVCISLGVVEHFYDGPAPLIQEMFRILRPGGFVFLTVPYYNFVRRVAIHPLRGCVLKLRSMVRGQDLRFSEYRFKRSEIEGITKSCGFEVVKVATDEYEPAGLALGLYMDMPLFRGGADGSLNFVGKLVRRATARISPWLTTGGILVLAKKPSHRMSEADIELEPLLSQPALQEDSLPACRS